MGSAWAVQVRLWRTERTKDEILRFMRISGSEELMNQRQDMIAYWDFNEPDDDRQATCPALQQLAALNDTLQCHGAIYWMQLVSNCLWRSACLTMSC